jgi:hypothetical protein
MLTKYVLPTINGDHRDVKPTRVLTTRIIKVEKLQEKKLEAQNNVEENQLIFVELAQKHREQVLMWRLCYLVS